MVNLMLGLFVLLTAAVLCHVAEKQWESFVVMLLTIVGVFICAMS
jgi:hypothetical protein